MVEVTWVDSVTEGGWTQKDEALRKAREETMRCRSVGYVLEHPATYLLLCESYMENGEVICGMTQIPSVAILGIRTLPEVEE